MKAARWTEDQLAAHLKRRAEPEPAAVEAPVSGPRFRSKLEVRYAQALDLMLAAGEIQDYRYEPMRLRLPGDLWYLPDFLVDVDGRQRPWMVECKGFMRRDDRMKLRLAVEHWRQFRWFVVGRSLSPQRLTVPDDVPPAGKGVQ